MATTPKTHRYTEAVGRRKTAIARVRIMPGTGKMTVNGKTPVQYFTLPRLVADARSPLEQLKLTEYDVTVVVSGGGIHAQAGAVRLGLSRAIIAKSPDWKPRLRTIGFLTRDSRMVERKKYGLNKARRAPQWAKR
jgi:small subunit ribosomal protein S9